jgi:SAM-dependent methyltransferase
VATEGKRTLREHWERAAQDWLRWARTPGHDHWYWEHNRPAFLSFLPAPGARTLDLACGEGRLTRDLRGLGHQVVGIDLSLALLRAAHELEPDLALTRADAARLPFADASFDLVIAFMSLFNLDDMPAALAEVGRVLMPGGRLCFAVVHPFASAGRFTGQEPDAPFVMKDSYMESRSRITTVERGGIKMDFNDMHRPLSSYSSALEGAGLVIEALREPVPGAEHASRPGVGQHRRLPLYLHVRALKPNW